MYVGYVGMPRRPSPQPVSGRATTTIIAIITVSTSNTVS